MEQGHEAEQPESEPTCSLVERHRAGDPEALNSLVERYYPRVRRIVGVRLRSRLLALTSVDDVVQDVFVRVLQGLERYETRDDARWIDWVARVAEREICGQARAQRTQKRDGPLVDLVRSAVGSSATWSIAAETAGLASKVANVELEGLVDQTLSELLEAQREVILLREYAGLDWRSIAELMNRPTPEACQELHRRALKELGARVRRKS